MKTGDGIIREYRIVNGRQELVRSVCLGGGVTVGGRGMDISRFLSEMPRRDIGLKPRSEWVKGSPSPKVRKAGAAEKVVEAKPVAAMPVELKPEERKALESIEAAEVETAAKEAEAEIAEVMAAVRREGPPSDLFDAMEYAGVVEPKAGGETRAVLPELPRPAGGGKKKHRRRRRR